MAALVYSGVGVHLGDKSSEWPQLRPVPRFSAISTKPMYGLAKSYVAGQGPATSVGFPPMDARKPSPSAGERLKELRVRLGLTTRDVEEKSQQIAEDKHSREYY